MVFLEIFSLSLSVFMCVTYIGRDDPPNPNTLTHILPLQCFNNPSHKSIVAFPTQCPPHVATLTVNQIIYDWFPKSWSNVIQASLLCCLRGCDARKSPTCARACFWLHRSRSRNSKLRVRPHICLTRRNKPKNLIVIVAHTLFYLFPNGSAYQAHDVRSKL